MDASGSLGFSLVERLLQRGYTVHAAVQNHDCNAQSLSSFYLFIDLLLTTWPDVFLSVVVFACMG
jgi:nucleoside-diphosphate-sugar epimerase